MSTSNWEDAKERSNYHFNKWHKDTDCVEHLGKFTGGWQTELQAVIEDAKPLNWGNRREGTGRENVNVDVEAEENDLKTAGADPKMTIYRGLKDFTRCPSLQRMTDYFALASTKSKLHVQFTGEDSSLCMVTNSLTDGGQEIYTNSTGLTFHTPRQTPATNPDQCWS